MQISTNNAKDTVKNAEYQNLKKKKIANDTKKFKSLKETDRY